MKRTSMLKMSFLTLCSVAIFTTPFSASAEETEETTVIVTKTETVTMKPMSDHNAVSLQTITPDAPKPAKKAAKKTSKKKTVKKTAKKVTAKKKASTKQKATVKTKKK